MPATQIPLYMLTAVDMRRATQSGNSRAISLAKLTIPGLKFISADHNPAGSVMAVDWVAPRIEAPEPKFEVRGIDIDAIGALGQKEKWLFAGALRDKRTNLVSACECLIEGVIAEWEPDEFDPKDFAGCSHTFKEVTHYSMKIAGVEKIYVDIWEMELRLNGVSIFAPERQALGL